MRDRLPISAVLIIGSSLLFSAVSIAGFILVQSHLLQWLLTMFVTNLVAFFVVRHFALRYPKQLGAIAFVSGTSILAVLPALWLFELDLPGSVALVAEDSQHAQSMAWLSCQRLAMDQFKAPSQTDFEMYPHAFTAALDRGRYSVQGIAHSPNSFGVKLRHLVVCDMQVVGDPESSSGWQSMNASAVQN